MKVGCCNKQINESTLLKNASVYDLRYWTDKDVLAGNLGAVEAEEEEVNEDESIFLLPFFFKNLVFLMAKPKKRKKRHNLLSVV